MRKSVVGSISALRLSCWLTPGLVHPQGTDAFAKVRHIFGNYRVVPNITYLTANNWEAKLDVYQARGAPASSPTLIYFHGGGWTGGFLPYLEMGWNVVNVEYRLAKVSLAPAAVEDGLCALRWVYRNAKDRSLCSVLPRNNSRNSGNSGYVLVVIFSG